jgi:hypothetical protein
MAIIRDALVALAIAIAATYLFEMLDRAFDLFVR